MTLQKSTEIKYNVSIDQNTEKSISVSCRVLRNMVVLIIFHTISICVKSNRKLETMDGRIFAYIEIIFILQSPIFNTIFESSKTVRVYFHERNCDTRYYILIVTTRNYLLNQSGMAFINVLSLP